MRVLHIGKYYFPFFGGVEKVTQDLVENDVYQGKVQSFILVHNHKIAENTTTEFINGVKVRKVKVNKILAYAPIALDFYSELNKALDEFKPDLIHIHMPNVSAFTCLFSIRAKKIPWVIHWHSDVIGAVPDMKVRLLYPYYRLFEKALLKRAHKIIVTSPPYLDKSNSLRRYKDKCFVIPIGIKDRCSAEPLKKRNYSCLNLLIIGRLTYYKGHKLLLEALSLLDKNINIHLNIVGEGELKTSLMKFVEDNKLHEKVNFLGRLNDNELDHQLMYCDLVCLPSIEKTEAFGVVLLEAAMHSKASIVSDVEGSGMSWVVQDKLTGFVSINNDVHDLKRQLERAFFKQEEVFEMGIRARLRFDSLFNIQHVSKEFISLYQKCIKY